MQNKAFCDLIGKIPSMYFNIRDLCFSSVYVFSQNHRSI